MNKTIPDISMEVQDVDASVTATLTCLMTEVSNLLNVTWLSENGIIVSTNGGYLVNQGEFRLDATQFYNELR